MAVWTLRASYDPEAKVYYTVDCDVPGLVTEGKTLDHLISRALAVMPELLEGNAHHIDTARRAPPHQLRVVFLFEHEYPVLEMTTA